MLCKKKKEQDTQTHTHIEKGNRPSQDSKREGRGRGSKQGKTLQIKMAQNFAGTHTDTHKYT